MGFRYKAHIQFDQMTLSDEAATKNLLIQLADRDIISHETLLERFNEIPQIENIRLKRELSKRDTTGPEKAGPFHPPPKPADGVDPKDRDNTTPDKITDIDADNGRPLFKKDDGPRKKRTSKPRTDVSISDMIVWADSAWEESSDIVSEAFISSLGKKNLRQLTKAQISDLEELKVDVLTNLDIGTKVTAEQVFDILKHNKKAPAEFKDILKNENVDISNMGIDLYRKQVIGLYVESKVS
tara:strand:- start:1145 stop:1864 length:720 start_codon:yes stop_codon:yes gene_type:complete